MSQIKQFFIDEIKFPFGKDQVEYLSVKELLAKDDKYLEECHNHVQWLLPTPQPSNYNPNSPILEKDDSVFLLASDNYLNAVKRMRQFFNQADLSYFNHNFLRITRMLQSMALVYGRDESVRMLSRVLQLPNLQYNYKSLEAWYKATLVTWDNPLVNV